MLTSCFQENIVNFFFGFSRSRRSFGLPAAMSISSSAGARVAEMRRGRGTTGTGMTGKTSRNVSKCIGVWFLPKKCCPFLDILKKGPGKISYEKVVVLNFLRERKGKEKRLDNVTDHLNPLVQMLSSFVFFLPNPTDFFEVLLTDLTRFENGSFRRVVDQSQICVLLDQRQGL